MGMVYVHSSFSGVEKGVV
uniref:Uncharacterized protein n=1 Tax=Anopheles christyi TaxID=43041 RepID=A0A182KI39_9DIPT